MPGRSNVVADLLSEIPEDGRSQPGELDSTADTGDLGSIDVCSVIIELPRRSSAETRADQMKDKEVEVIIDAFESESPGDDLTRFTQRGCVMSGGVLYRYSPDSGDEEPQLVVPTRDRERPYSGLSWQTRTSYQSSELPRLRSPTNAARPRTSWRSCAHVERFPSTFEPFNGDAEH